MTADLQPIIKTGDLSSLGKCPFCKSEMITLGYDGQPATSFYAVCTACKAQGPAFDYWTPEVFAAWNKGSPTDMKVWMWYQDGEIPLWVEHDLAGLAEQRDLTEFHGLEYTIRLHEPADKFQRPGHPARTRLPSKKGYMCAVDFRFHLEDDGEPQSIYRDVESLNERRPCAREECGAVEVEINVTKILSTGHGT